MCMTTTFRYHRQLPFYSTPQYFSIFFGTICSIQRTPPSTKGSCETIPLRLAYATTFDGCQGLTLVKTSHCRPFANGQLSTALSHIRSRHDSLADKTQPRM
ncbi:hypothetical protein SCLCIDRAFT_1225483 [Scleroderma citrinum Foug A]|uniref:Uncharacterized protein n=1 Tax=Scleroderma citrinum Foug A TaxID=1036808 RepID=A0A0C3D182_9AGAM|nr:hypothetical protein SCLCIDRAFT_1225483 [Scleroderma citrinum Foug A]